MTAFGNDYATPERLAIHLEIGWSDYLFETSGGGDCDADSRYPDPLVDRVPPDFYREAAALARCWADDISLDPQSLCDVGSGTGRAVFEIEAMFPELERLLLLEPSERFCEWARLLLSTAGELPDVPVVDRTGCPRWVAPKSRPPAIRNADKRLSIANTTLARYEPQEGFDLVVCLNVVDRHPCPTALIRELGGLLNDNGLLVLSSPLDFHETITPDRETWIEDLNSLFQGLRSWSHVGEDEAFYEYRSFNRSWTRFSSQVVGKRWRESGA